MTDRDPKPDKFVESEKTRAHSRECTCEMCWGSSFRMRLRREKYER